MRRSLLILPLLLWVAACGPDPNDPALTPVVGEADVERFRAEVFLETLPLDADLARFEGQVADFDSVTQAAYAPLLDALRERRRRLQIRVDTLGPLPQALFDTTRAGIRDQTERLRRMIARAPMMGAPDLESLATTTQRVLGEVSTGADALRSLARADTTGAIQTGLDSLAAGRDRLQRQLRTYADTSDALFPPFRQRVTDTALRLRSSLRALQPDSLKSDNMRRPGGP